MKHNSLASFYVFNYVLSSNYGEIFINFEVLIYGRLLKNHCHNEKKCTKKHTYQCQLLIFTYHFLFMKNNCWVLAHCIYLNTIYI